MQTTESEIPPVPVEAIVHTPGPWAWFGNGKHGVYLATIHSGRRYIMDFVRMGMRGAQPRFQPHRGNGMRPSSELLMFEVGNQDVRGIKEAEADSSVYRFDVRGIDCADARLIAAAPELLDALRALVRAELPEADNLDDPDIVNIAVSHMDHEDYRRRIREANELISRVV